MLFLLSFSLPLSLWLPLILSVSRVLLDSLPCLAACCVRCLWRHQCAALAGASCFNRAGDAHSCPLQQKNVEFTERGKKTPSQVAPVLCIRIRGEVRVDRKTSGVAMKVVKITSGTWNSMKSWHIVKKCQNNIAQHSPSTKQRCCGTLQHRDGTVSGQEMIEGRRGRNRTT